MSSTSSSMRSAFIALSISAMLFGGSDLEAQQNLMQECSQQELVTGGVDRDRDPRDPNGGFKVRFVGLFELRCHREGRTVRADSAHHYENSQMLELFGHVNYTQGATNIVADHMRYFKSDDHVEADGNVIAKLETGSTVSGPSIKFYRKRPAVGTPDRLIAVGGPHFVLVDRDSATGKTDSTQIDSRTLLMEGDNVFASGNVVITRANLDATGDSVYANKNPKERLLRLMRGPQLNLKNADSIVLRGNVVEILADSSQNLKQVKSLGGGNVTGKELKLNGDTIDLRMDQQDISRAFAFGDSGAFMESQGSTMRGDSLDIQMTKGKPSRIHSIANAQAELAPDSVATGSATRDKIKGDTVLIALETVVQRPRRTAADSAVMGGLPTLPVDTAKRDTVTVPSSISAKGNALMLYTERSRTNAAVTCPGVQYAVGNQIHVTLKSGDIQTLEVVRGGVVPYAMGANSQCNTQQRPDTTAGRAGGAGPPRIPPR